MPSTSRKIQLAIKRAFDFTAALIGIIVLSPLLLLIAVLVRATSPGPALFLQDRVGQGRRVFKLYKFRTMVEGAEQMGTGLKISKGDSRITKIGSILRKTSLDEIPQLFNVLKGDISLVGPRPVVPLHLEYYGPFEYRRLEVRPGITGLAAVRGRASTPWSVRIRNDVEYVDRFSLWLDFTILLRTIKVVLLHEGVYYDYEKHGPSWDLVKPGERPEEENADDGRNQPDGLPSA